MHSLLLFLSALLTLTYSTCLFYKKKMKFITLKKNAIGLYKFWCGQAFTKESLDRRTVKLEELIDDDDDEFVLNTSRTRGNLHRTTSFQIAPGSNILVK